MGHKMDDYGPCLDRDGLRETVCGPRETVCGPRGLIARPQLSAARCVCVCVRLCVRLLRVNGAHSANRLSA